MSTEMQPVTLIVSLGDDARPREIDDATTRLCTESTKVIIRKSAPN